MMKSSKQKKLVYIGITTLLLLFCTVGFLILAPAFHTPPHTYLYIDDDDNIDSVRNKLYVQGGFQAETGFRLISSIGGYRIHTGRYTVADGDCVLSIYRKLRSGQQQAVNLVLPSTRTLDQLAGFLSRKLMLDSTHVAHAFADTSFCKEFGFNPQTLHALFIPNTYQVYWNTSLPSFMKRMKREYDDFWTEKRKQQAKAIGLTPIEVATLASIVDEETATNSEKPMVAGMYLNRLRSDMPLQADPTIKYALRDFALRRIYHKHLSTISPYNTYTNTGLPPGPIRIASMAGIDAVLYATQHNFLYMCAKEDFSGTHNFASTYAEHLRNAAKYSRALNERGIK